MAEHRFSVLPGRAMRESLRCYWNEKILTLTPSINIVKRHSSEPPRKRAREW